MIRNFIKLVLVEIVNKKDKEKFLSGDGHQDHLKSKAKKSKIPPPPDPEEDGDAYMDWVFTYLYPEARQILIKNGIFDKFEYFHENYEDWEAMFGIDDVNDIDPEDPRGISNIHAIDPVTDKEVMLYIPQKKAWIKWQTEENEPEQVIYSMGTPSLRGKQRGKLN